MEQFEKYRLEQYKRRMAEDIYQSEFLEYNLQERFRDRRDNLELIIHEQEMQEILPFLVEIYVGYASKRYEGGRDAK